MKTGSARILIGSGPTRLDFACHDRVAAAAAAAVASEQLTEQQRDQREQDEQRPLLVATIQN